MWLKVNWLTLSAVFSLIRQNFSAIILRFNELDQAMNYSRLRTASVYRGILFSFSPAQKNEICRDIFYAQLYAVSDHTENGAYEINAKRLITDGLPATDKPAQHPLILAKVITSTDAYRQEIYFKCVGGPFGERISSVLNEYYVSSAFLYNWYYSSIQYKNSTEYAELMHCIVSSPENVPFERTELEKYYVQIRRTIDVLKEESSEFVELIEGRNNLRLLSRWQKLLLCASILSSPIFRKDRLQFSLDWIHEILNTQQYVEGLPLVQISLAFRNPDYANEDLTSDCIFCEAFHTDGDSRNLYLTRSYGDDHSLIVLIEDNGRIFLDKYFKNISLLMNAHENMENISILPSFHYLDEFK